MKRYGIAVLEMVLFASLAMVSEAAEKQERTIVVQGQGKASAIPDIATLSIEVSQDGAELDPVLTKVRKDMEKVLDVIKKQDIPEKDIRTELFQVNPKFEADKRGNARRVGYTVTNRVSVKVRDLKKTGKVLSASLNAGATSVHGPQFELDNPSQVEREALAAATRDAKAKAQAVAEAAGVQLGEIISIQPQHMNWPVPVYRGRAMAMMASADVASEPVSAGEQTLTGHVSLTFEIK
jgi:uncharacterized protein